MNNPNTIEKINKDPTNRLKKYKVDKTIETINVNKNKHIVV